ncbi:adenylate and guanylate cyclase catalytic domain-containing protein [Polychytrium aggregatum]|uniref:adenylate and guanylate cyclase catalytic domain-containing protein n=1 Tax=Polychytrium aggregatum TaxID=110093 RepID=UPI0022FF2A9D|nr:adenylate and guanylate cyclase catalytic domain-containing protein [Polychytrium aggregatum]KAI9203914.1 adenylate and guanylate cyclase catalytic domain-containing protein [Polychytrium aggregatum]
MTSLALMMLLNSNITDATDTIRVLRLVQELPETGPSLQFDPPTERMYRMYLYQVQGTNTLQIKLWILSFYVFTIILLDLLSAKSIDASTIYKHTLGYLYLLTSIAMGILCHRPSWESLDFPVRIFWIVLFGLENLTTTVFALGLFPSSTPVSRGSIIALSEVGTIAMIYLSASSHYGTVTATGLTLTAAHIALTIVSLMQATPGNQSGSMMNSLYIEILLYLSVNFVGFVRIYMTEVYIRRAFIKHRIICKHQENIMEARNQSHLMLGMILPAKIAQLMRENDFYMSPDSLNMIQDTFLELHGVTILFADIVGFTEFSSQIPAYDLVGVLSDIFSEFDNIVTDFGLEKIKTIGDCIEIAGGVPEQLQSETQIANEAEKVCIVALLMIHSIRKISQNIRRNLRLRVGIHTGSILAGVVGLWKFKYDIWSQDVEIASLMEQKGTPDIPHVSQSTEKLLRNKGMVSFEPDIRLDAFGREINTFNIPTDSISFKDLCRIRSTHIRLYTCGPTETHETATRWTEPEQLPSDSTDDGNELHTPPSGDLKGEDSDIEILSFSREPSHPPLANRQLFTEPKDLARNRQRPSQRSSQRSPQRIPGVHIFKESLNDSLRSFQCSIGRWTGFFLDQSQERDYCRHYMKNHMAALFITAGVTFVVYIILFTSHVLLVPSEYLLLILEGLGGLVLLAVIIGFYHSKIWRRLGDAIETKYDEWIEFFQHMHRTVLPLSQKPRQPKRKSKESSRSCLPNLFALTTIWFSFVGNLVIAITHPSARIQCITCVVIVLMMHTIYVGMKMFLFSVSILVCAVIFSIPLLVDKSPLLDIYTAQTIVPILAVAVTLLYFTNRKVDMLARTNFYLKTQNEDLYTYMKQAQQSAEKLLLNILPLSVILRLKENPFTHIADDREDVSILFTGITNFLPFEQASQKHTIWLLNAIICDIDECCASFGIEKIKTIDTALTHPFDGVDAHRIQMIDFALTLKKVIRDFNKRTNQKFLLRTGIHAGPAVSGVIGTRTFTFDVWGDTVNVASRMESTGKENEIQVTEEVYQRLRGDYEFQPRGSVEIKGKGWMRTYFVRGSVVRY